MDLVQAPRNGSARRHLISDVRRRVKLAGHPVWPCAILGFGSHRRSVVPKRQPKFPKENRKETAMIRTAVLLALTTLLTAAGLVHARDQGNAQSSAGYGQNAVPAGTRFLIGLQDTLNTKDAKARAP